MSHSSLEVVEAVCGIQVLTQSSLCYLVRVLAPLCLHPWMHSAAWEHLCTGGHEDKGVVVGWAGPTAHRWQQPGLCCPVQAPLCLSTLLTPLALAAACTALPTCLTCMSFTPSCPSLPLTHWGQHLASHRPAPHSHPVGCSPSGRCVARPSCLTSCSGLPYPQSWGPPPR